MIKLSTRAALAAVAILVAAASSHAAVLYDRSTLGSTYTTPGVNTVIFDDIPVPTSRLGGTPASVDLGRLTFNVFLDTAVATAFDATAYIVTINPSDSTVTSVTPIGSVTFPVGLASDVYTLTFGDATTTLATVTPDYTINPAFGIFFVGLSFGANENVGPVVSTGPDGAINAFGLYDLDNPNSPNNGYGYQFDDATIPNSFSIIVESPVPEPTGAAVLAPAALALVQRRRD